MRTTPLIIAAVAMLLESWACAPPTSRRADGGSGGGEDGGGGDYDARHDGSADAQSGDLVTIRGTIWSPGADLNTTIENNRFPIPGTAVIAHTMPPADIEQGRYCNECVEVPSGTPNVMSNPVDGTFEIRLVAGRTYFFTIQKGEFRRVREYTVPANAGGLVEFTSEYGAPRPEMTTLPSRTDLALGDNIPKIAMIRGAYEDMEPVFTALGFDYDHAGVDFDIFCEADDWDPCPGATPASLLRDPAVLDRYNVILVSCGEEWPGRDAAAAENLRRWVENGGSLYVDDFNYDFVEQPWPDFLSWYVDGWDSAGSCGTPSNPSDGLGSCNNWSSYDFTGNPNEVPDFAGWLGLSDVTRGEPLTLYAAWDYLHEMGEGIVGVDDHGSEVRSRPRVWMYNTDSVPFGSGQAPATVSWPYYCGKVLYTVYHTHSSDGEGEGFNYELLLQEKIMMYLIMEVQTCASAPMVY